ncbi:MAG: hypothetical protein DRH21_05435 [Deltaproteobacteria bacterium]|nr:MAG: hypothetical protein DRH21_05435 [Deltaproteobacteria bacterium]
MKRFFILLFFAFLFTFSYSQDEGNVQVIQDDRIDTLLNIHIELNEQDPQIEGWRINIFFEAGNYSKRLAIEAKSEFVNKYANVPCYLIFQEPYYKVRIGDYLSKMEAEKFLNEIEQDYPNAFVVQDDINFPSLD